MTTTTGEITEVTDIPVPPCPLCGMELNPLWDDVLCPICHLDEAEKLADYRAEQEQAWFPL